MLRLQKIFVARLFVVRCVFVLFTCILYLPAIQAVMKQATFPAIIALTTTLVMSFFLEGAIALRLPIIMPIEPMLENPHSA